MTSIQGHKRPDYTNGEKFWKWFFTQTSNVIITVFSVLGVLFMIWKKEQFDSTDELIAYITLPILWGLLNLILSYRSYKQLQRGISK